MEFVEANVLPSMQPWQCISSTTNIYYLQRGINRFIIIWTRPQKLFKVAQMPHTGGCKYLEKWHFRSYLTRNFACRWLWVFTRSCTLAGLGQPFRCATTPNANVCFDNKTLKSTVCLKNKMPDSNIYFENLTFVWKIQRVQIK